MKKIVLILLIAFFSVPAFCQLPYTQKLKQIAEIKLPGAPVTKELPQGITMYYYKDPGEIYFAQVAAYKKSLGELFTSNVNEKIYNNYITGNINSSKGKLIYKSKATIAGLEGIEYAYLSNLPKKKFYSYSRLVFLNDTLLNFSLLTPDPLLKEDPKLRAYFNTLKITIPKDQIVANNAQEIGSRVGKFVAIIILIAIPILLGLGIVFLIKRTAYRKNKA